MNNTQPGNVSGPIVNVPGSSNTPMVGVGPQGRLPSSVGPSGPGGVGQHKAEAGMWAHASTTAVAAGGRNAAAWVADDTNHNVTSASNWVDDKSNSNITQIGSTNSSGGTSSWNDSAAAWSKNQTKLNSSTSNNWAAAGIENNDINADWSTHGGIVKSQQQQQKLAGINTDIIKQSKQYRMLVETGFKKEDVERALIATNMNFEEAAEMLRVDSWSRRHDETALGSYADHISGGFSARYPATAAQPNISFPPVSTIFSNISIKTNFI